LLGFVHRHEDLRFRGAIPFIPSPPAVGLCGGPVHLHVGGVRYLFRSSPPPPRNLLFQELSFSHLSFCWRAGLVGVVRPFFVSGAAPFGAAPFFHFNTLRFRFPQLSNPVEPPPLPPCFTKMIQSLFVISVMDFLSSPRFSPSSFPFRFSWLWRIPACSFCGEQC